MADRDSATGRFVAAAEAKAEQSIPEQVVLQSSAADSAARAAGATDTATQAEQYPTGHLRQQEEQDRINIIKSQLANARGETPYGKMTWSDEIAKWLLRKQQAAKKAAFQDWFAKNFDKLDEGRKAVARELYPRYYEERAEMIKENLDTLEQLAMLRLYGTRSPRDLALKYAAENGMIDMTPLTNILHPERVLATEGPVRFQRGLLNPDASINMGTSVDANIYTGQYNNPAYASPFLPGITGSTTAGGFGGLSTNAASIRGLGMWPNAPAVPLPVAAAAPAAFGNPLRFPQ